MSDTAQFIIIFLILAVAGGLLWARYASQKRIEKRREAEDEFWHHRGGGGPR